MKNSICMLSILLFTICCKTKKSSIDKDIIKSYNSIYLDANENKNVLNSVKFTNYNVAIDQLIYNSKVYKLSKFKSITDTINGEYSIKVDSIAKHITVFKSNKN